MSEQKANELPDNIAAELTEMVQHIRVAKQHIADVKAELEPVILHARSRIENLLREFGDGNSWSDDQGYARLVAPGKRVSYDVKKLDQLIADHPDKFGYLSGYRKETVTRGGLQIK